MSKEKTEMKDIKKSITNLIETLENKLVLGPVGYLEECIDNIDAAIEEYETYEQEESE